MDDTKIEIVNEGSHADTIGYGGKNFKVPKESGLIIRILLFRIAKLNSVVECLENSLNEKI